MAKLLHIEPKKYTVTRMKGLNPSRYSLPRIYIIQEVLNMQGYNPHLKGLNPRSKFIYFT